MQVRADPVSAASCYRRFMNLYKQLLQETLLHKNPLNRSEDKSWRVFFWKRIAWLICGRLLGPLGISRWVMRFWLPTLETCLDKEEEEAKRKKQSKRRWRRSSICLRDLVWGWSSKNFWMRTQTFHDSERSDEWAAPRRSEQPSLSCSRD